MNKMVIFSDFLSTFLRFQLLLKLLKKSCSSKGFILVLLLKVRGKADDDDDDDDDSNLRNKLNYKGPLKIKKKAVLYINKINEVNTTTILN